MAHARACSVQRSVSAERELAHAGTRQHAPAQLSTRFATRCQRRHHDHSQHSERDVRRCWTQSACGTVALWRTRQQLAAKSRWRGARPTVSCADGLLTSDFRLLTSSELWLCGYQKRRPLMTSCEIRSDEIRFKHDSPRLPRCEKLPRPILNRCRASKSEAGVAERWVPMQRSSLLTSDFRFRLANPEVCTGYRCRNVTSDFRLCCARAAGRENINNN